MMKKKKFLIFSIIAVSLLAVSCTSNEAKKDSVAKTQVVSGQTYTMDGSDLVYYAEPDPLEENELRIHYKRNNNDYDNYTVWAWNDTTWGGSSWPNGIEKLGETEYGAYYDVPLKENAANIGFLLVDKTAGDDGKDGGDKSFTKFAKYNQIFLQEGNETVYVGQNNETADGLESAALISNTEILLSFTNASVIKAEDLQLKNKYGLSLAIENIDVKNDNDILVKANLREVDYPYSISHEGFSITLNPGIAYFDGMHAYAGDDLGANFMADGSISLKVWSPMAEEAYVVIFDKNNPTEELETLEMTKEDKGVWSAELDESAEGYFYQYKFMHKGDKEYTYALDPYAKSMAEFNVNSEASNTNEIDPIGKAALINPSKIGYVAGFADIEGYEKREDAVIYEVHVRDFTSQKGLELDNQFGTYSALVEKLDYLKEMGVTHIQLLPVMASYYGMESKNAMREWEYSAKNNNYNWGYDPHSYFSPDGMYSENPKDPALRIKELKALIQAVHEKGMGVTLDVVYNHSANQEIFENVVPRYYGFANADGSPKNSFGGLQMGTTHAMTRKLVVDSIKYWTEEFKVDGFRFDMMGSTDAESMQMSYDAAVAINPKTLMIGEGWRTFNGDAGVAGVVPADQDWMSTTDDVAVFSDEIRNELKSGFGSEGQPRFITGGERSINTIFNNVKGQPGNFVADDPGDVVQYIAAHDNLPLHDVIAHSIRKNSNEHQGEIQKRIRLGNTMILTSQGIAFIHAGQEYGRTKEWLGEGTPQDKYTVVDEANQTFIHDSYDSSDRINYFDWDAIKAGGRGHVTAEYTKGLIDIRRKTDAFRLGTKELVDANVELVYPAVNQKSKMIAYKTTATNGEEYYVFINGYAEGEAPKDSSLAAGEFMLATDLTSATVIADANEANFDGVNELNGVKVEAGKVVVDPLTAVIIKK